jgi:hypothetical protein
MEILRRLPHDRAQTLRYAPPFSTIGQCGMTCICGFTLLGALITTTGVMIWAAADAG